MASGCSGFFIHIHSSDDKSTGEKSTDEVTTQKSHFQEVLGTATTRLREGHFKMAKIDFREAMTLLQNCQLKNISNELPFYISVGLCYCFIMDLENIKDTDKEDFITDDKKVKEELGLLLSKYPKRHLPMILNVLYAFKKECWREALYFCEGLQNFKVSLEEENKYKSLPVFSTALFPELDLDYCKEMLDDIEEASIYGLVEKVAKLNDIRSSRGNLSGFNWIKLWSKDFHDKIIKKIRSYKKPMDPFQLHKMFHADILPKFVSLNPKVPKALSCYYKKDYMYKCDECLKAKLQQESRKEILRRIHEDMSNDMSDGSDCYDSYGEEDDDDDLFIGSDDEIHRKSMCEDKCECKDKVTEKKDLEEKTDDSKGEKEGVKAVGKNQQTQTEKGKLLHRYVQTEVGFKKKSVAAQTDVVKAKKLDEPVKCTKCNNLDKLFNILEEIKNQLPVVNVDINESLNEQLTIVLNKFAEENNNKVQKNSHGKTTENGFDFNQFTQLKETIVKLEREKKYMQEKFEKEQKDIAEKNILLQKLLIDQINDKYNIYKNTYGGLENNCRVIIANVTELHNFLNHATVPNANVNQSYLKRWEKTLSDLQIKNGQLKSFYKKTKTQMIRYSEYEFNDWPEIAEIPIEAFSFLFDNLKQNVKNNSGGQQRPMNQNVPNQNINNAPTHPNMPQPMQGPQMYGPSYPGVMPLNARSYVGSGLRYSLYPPPPIPMPPSKSSGHSNNQNQQMYQPNPWVNPQNSNVSTFFNNFPKNPTSSQNHSMHNNYATTTNTNQTIVKPSLDDHSSTNASENKSGTNENQTGVVEKNTCIVENVTAKVENNSALFDNQCANVGFAEPDGGKIRQRPVGRPKLVNVCEGTDKNEGLTKVEGLGVEKIRTYNEEKELFRYLKSKCNDVDDEELIHNFLKVLKKHKGALKTMHKTDILKEVKSSILTTKHGVWISPRSPLVDWENDHTDTHCSICFDDLTQRPKCTLPCKHEYHKDCIKQWLRTSSVCPICRVHSVIDEDYPPLA